MHLARPVYAPDPRAFGRRASTAAVTDGRIASASVADDLRLFGTTFAAGFLFVWILLG